MGKSLQSTAGTILATLLRSAASTESLYALNSFIKIKINLCLIYKIPHKISFPSARHLANEHARHS